MPTLITGHDRRWGLNLLTEQDGPHENQIAEMCDYGARQFGVGECDAVRFDCMPNEVVMINAYMAERHPSVRFFCRRLEDSQTALV